MSKNNPFLGYLNCLFATHITPKMGCFYSFVFAVYYLLLMHVMIMSQPLCNKGSKQTYNLHSTRTKRCTHDHQTLSYLHGSGTLDYFSSIMLIAFNHLFWSKFCRQNSSPQTPLYVRAGPTRLYRLQNSSQTKNVKSHIMKYTNIVPCMYLFRSLPRYRFLV